MNNEIEKVIARRQRAYARAVSKTELAYAKFDAYKKANDGFASSEMVEMVEKAQVAQSKAYAAMVKAEKAA